MHKRLHTDETERDGSDSNCSDSVVGNTGAFRPTPNSPKEGTTSAANSSYPSPNISVGPPIHPPPHLLPYLYPHGLYPPPHLSLLHNPAAAMNPSLLFNAQLALAAQHPNIFGHYSGQSSSSSQLSGIKGHRFSPYNLAGGLGSAFEAVTPGGTGHRSLSSSPKPRATSNTPPTRPLSTTPPNSSKNQMHTISGSSNTTIIERRESLASPSELKSIENMVNGLDSQHSANGIEEVPKSSLND